MIGRGGTLWRIDDLPIVLMYGSVPAYRTLEQGISDGPDVAELNQNLIDLGFDPYGAIADDESFGEATAAAVKRWQKAEGLPETGEVELGRVVFAPGARRVTDVKVTLGQDPPGAATPTATTPAATTPATSAETTSTSPAATTPAANEPGAGKSPAKKPGDKSPRKGKGSPGKGEGSPGKEKEQPEQRKAGERKAGESRRKRSPPKKNLRKKHPTKTRRAENRAKARPAEKPVPAAARWCSRRPPPSRSSS